MNICERLYEAVLSRAENARVEMVSVGLGYTAVSASDGGVGLAYTMLVGKAGCAVMPADLDFEGGPALDLLQHIQSSRPIYRSMALALVNALNWAFASSLPEDRSNDGIFDILKIGDGSRVAMVGYFGPLMDKLSQRGAAMEVVDIDRDIGNAGDFKEKLADWAEVLILTSTSILNDTADDLLAAVGPKVRVLMMGPSTPMTPAAFAGLPVHMLAGTVPVDRDAVFRTVRHGKGTPAFQKYGKKVFLTLNSI